jgi:hypothetical protein
MKFYMPTTLVKIWAHTASSVVKRHIRATSSDVYFTFIYPLPNLIRLGTNTG